MDGKTGVHLTTTDSGRGYVGVTSKRSCDRTVSTNRVSETPVSAVLLRRPGVGWNHTSTVGLDQFHRDVSVDPTDEKRMGGGRGGRCDGRDVGPPTGGLGSSGGREDEG